MFTIVRCVAGLQRFGRTSRGWSGRIIRLKAGITLLEMDALRKGLIVVFSCS
jgi:hypothetical protein